MKPRRLGHCRETDFSCAGNKTTGRFLEKRFVGRIFSNLGELDILGTNKEAVRIMSDSSAIEYNCDLDSFLPSEESPSLSFCDETIGAFSVYHESEKETRFRQLSWDEKNLR